QTDDSIAARHAAKTLYRKLVDPVAGRIAGATTVVFVPDASVSTVPFSALLDPGGHYLIEQRNVVVAPSAAVFMAAAQRRRNAPPPASVVIIENPDAGAGGGALTFVSGEANSVAREYRQVI